MNLFIGTFVISLFLYSLRTKILAEKHRARVVPCKNPYDYEGAPGLLRRVNILTTENIASLRAHSTPYNLANGFVKLHINGCFSPENKAALIASIAPHDLAFAFTDPALSSNSILLAENRAALIAHSKPHDLARAFDILEQVDILIPDNRAAVITHTFPRYMALALRMLHHANILNPDNRAVILAHASEDNFINAVFMLGQARILDQTNFNMIIAHPNPSYLARAFCGLHQAGLLTAENRTLAVSSDTSHRLTIPCGFINIDELVFSQHFANVNAIFIMTSNKAEYERISALLPGRFHEFILPRALFAKIHEVQLKALYGVDMFSLRNKKLLDSPISLVQEYEGRIDELMSQVLLPFREEELEQYEENLQKCLASVFNPSTLDEKQAQVKAIKQLIKWLCDDAMTLSVEELALLGAQRSVWLILEKNPLKLATLSALKNQLMATPGYQNWCYEQERRSLRQQQFLFKFERDCLWRNKDSSPQSQEAFDRQFGIVPYSR
ncbi:MAG: hypothetical protein EBY16_07745 [Gammaproteobacteria bacterium]|nr:hypothetical protein [Gammaproteobacteria bacterium]